MKNNLRKELLKEGAGSNEAESLAQLAQQLSAARPRGLSAHAKQRLYNRLPFDEPKERPVFRWAMAGSLAGAMALLVLVFLPGAFRTNPAQPNENDVRALVQPVETELQELDMKVEELQQQGTIDEAQLQEAEKQYDTKLEDLKKRYQNNERFRNYDWSKWYRNRQNHNNSQDSDQSDRVNGASTSSSDDSGSDSSRYWQYNRD